MFISAVVFVIRRTVLIDFSVYLLKWVIMQLYNSTTQSVLCLASETTLSFFAFGLSLSLMRQFLASCCKIFPCCFILVQALERAISKEPLFFHMKVVGRQGVGDGS